MRSDRPISKLLVQLLIIAAFAASCSKETTTPLYKYYVSKETALQLTKEYLSTLVDAASVTYPKYFNSNRSSQVILQYIKLYIRQK